MSAISKLSDAELADASQEAATLMADLARDGAMIARGHANGEGAEVRKQLAELVAAHQLQWTEFKKQYDDLVEELTHRVFGRA